jgi:hypothetical protein
LRLFEPVDTIDDGSNEIQHQIDTRRRKARCTDGPPIPPDAEVKVDISRRVGRVRDGAVAKELEGMIVDGKPRGQRARNRTRERRVEIILSRIAVRHNKIPNCQYSPEIFAISS